MSFSKCALKKKKKKMNKEKCKSNIKSIKQKLFKINKILKKN